MSSSCSSSLPILGMIFFFLKSHSNWNVSTLVLICMSLMINNAEHLFMCLFALVYIFFYKMSNILPIFKLGSILLLLNFESLLYILNIRYVVPSQSMAYFFNFLTVPFKWNFLILMKCNLDIIYGLYCWCQI